MTRKHLAAAIDDFDEQIDELQEGKRDLFKSYRFELQNAGWDKDRISDEVAAFKKAMSVRRAEKRDPERAERMGDLVDEILVEIQPRAPRATRARENIEEFGSGSDAASRPPGASESLNSPAGGEAEERPAEIQTQPQGDGGADGCTNPVEAVTAGETAPSDAPLSVSSLDLPEARMPRASLSNSEPRTGGASEPSSAEVSTEAEEGTQSKGVRTAGKSSGKRSGGDRLPVPSPDPHRLGSFSREARFDELAAKFRVKKVDHPEKVSTEIQEGANS